MSVKGIPTKHNGRQYRSRLEARWGAFFDILGWQHEYEPFDANGWIPDFALIPRNSDRAPVLVEIKPEAVFPAPVARKIDKAYPFLYPCSHVLIVGFSIGHLKSDEGTFSPGWLREAPYNEKHTRDAHGWADPDQAVADIWQVAAFGLWKLGGPIGISPTAGGWGNLLGAEGGKFYDHPEETNRAVLSAWTRAGNETQWMRPQC